MSKNKKLSEHKMQYPRIINEWDDGFGNDFWKIWFQLMIIRVFNKTYKY